jgi:periplasmic protein TonB
MTVLVDIERRPVVAPMRGPSRRRPRIAIAALVSVGLHLMLIAGIVLWMQRSHSIALVPAENPATVELVMSPPGGEPAAAAAAPADKPSEKSPAPETSQETAAVSPTPTVAPAPAEEPAPAVATPPPPAPAAPTADEPPPPAPSAEAPAAPPPPAPPAPKPAENKLTFDFAQAESDTNAWVTGSSVLPPSPDIKFHNRKPSYPMAAAQRGEQGTVVLLIHVTAEGVVTDVEVARSSGFPTLDRAASDAVQTWHFLPSIKDGAPAPSDVQFGFVFSLD